MNEICDTWSVDSRASNGPASITRILALHEYTYFALHEYITRVHVFCITRVSITRVHVFCQPFRNSESAFLMAAKGTARKSSLLSQVLTAPARKISLLVESESPAAWKPLHLAPPTDDERDIVLLDEAPTKIELILTSIEFLALSLFVAALSILPIVFDVFVRNPCPKCQESCCFSNSETRRIASQIWITLQGICLQFFLLVSYKFSFSAHLTKRAFLSSCVFALADASLRVTFLGKHFFFSCSLIDDFTPRSLNISLVHLIRVSSITQGMPISY